MRINLSIAYWGLLLISLISSCLLFIIVASEATKLSDKAAPGGQYYVENSNKNYKETTTTTVIENNENYDYVDVKTAKIDSGQLSENYVDVNNVKHENQGNVADQGSIDQTEANDDKPESLPDLPANPAVITLGDKAPDILIENALIDDIDDESIIINTLADSLVNKSEEALKMDHLTMSGNLGTLSETKSAIKKEVVLPHESPPPEGNLNEIDDSASIIGSDTSQESKDSQILSDEIAHVDTPIVATPQTGTAANSDGTQTPSPEVNLTVEENPIPVFSEWAQKQMEEAEKKLEKQTVNSSAMRKNATSGSKPQLMKLRAKNYASPDCGAKIIASNSEAQNTGAVLSALKDEYMLSPCTNRIWFVVELCEAIQAEKIELANFELFSSSPKNFSVSVNNRFPTREWSNVGRFVAEDQRNIQSFDLFPHLFGKFVRVDIHSHYHSEHFCPISLFRVYGTSEFEAFETENRPPVDDVDDFEEDDALDQGVAKNENTLFKSASDAVMSIVKKAAEVLVKTNSNKTETNINQNHSTHTKQEYCFTPRYPFTCEKCNIASGYGGPSSNSNIEDFVTNVNYLLSCKYNLLTSLLSIDLLRNHITSSRICANNFNLNVNNYENLDCSSSSSSSSTNSRNSNYKVNQLNGDNNVNFDDKSSYLLGSFSLQYLAAMCHILATLSKTNKSSKYSTASPDNALNLTIDQKPSAKFANVESLGTKTETVNGIDSEILKDRGPKLTIVNKPYTQQQESTQQIYDRDRPEVDSDIKFDNLNEYKSDDSHKRSANAGKDSATGAEYDDFQTQIKSPPTTNEIGDTKDDSNISSMENVNIFNIVEDATLPEYTPEPSLSMPQPTIPSSTSEEIDTTKTILVDSGDSMAKIDEVPSSTTPPSTTKTKEIEVETNTWDNLDHIILAESVEPGSHIDTNLPSHATPQKVHSESVFLRLSNRVKALERNMSLSGQYLEELSRRYKKQVEELQHSFAKTLSAIEEQNRRAIDREELLFEENRKLKADLDEVSNRLNSWITLVICLGTFVILQIIFAWILITSARRQQFKLLKRFEDNSLLRRRKSNVPRTLLRRRSVEGVSGHPSPVHKPRRPSEEAMQICGSYKNLLIEPTSTERSEEAVKDDESNDTLGEMTRKRSYKKKKLSQGKKTDSITEALIKIKNYEDISPNSSASGLSIPTDGQLLLDEDYESYTPGSDLAYNEFMPEGPSGKQSQINGKSTNGVSTKSSKKSSKLRRLSSPGFLKSPFGRSTSGGSGGKKLAHGPTGWEWYRLKKTDTSPTSSQERSSMKKSKSVSPEVKIKINGIGSNSQNSSISEFVPAPSNDGSSDSIRTSTTNSILGNGNNSSKKQGSFRRILKKVF